MSQTAVATRTKFDDREVKFTPLGENQELTLTPAMVRSQIAVPTRSGKHPNDQDIIKFIQLCKARELNPWVNDAYLVGYDSNNGPVYQLIVAIQALYKRAEINPNYDGIESGVIVKRNNEFIELVGDFFHPGDTLVGAWAKCYRKDQSIPLYERIKFETFNTGKSRWAADPGGMIVKCAEASVLRRAFPNSISGLYVAGEMRETITNPAVSNIEHKSHQTKSDAIASLLPPAETAPPETNELRPEDYDPPGSPEQEAATQPPADDEPQFDEGTVAGNLERQILTAIPEDMGELSKAITAARSNSDITSKEATALKKLHAAREAKLKEMGL